MESVEIDKKQVITEIIEQFQQNIDHLFASFDIDRLLGIIEKVLSRRSTLLFTGVGKSGVIAQKIAATMTSLGTRALYISSQDALHGDIGVVEEGDIVFLLSKSGETDELISLCPALHAKGAYLVAVVSRSSRLSKRCDEEFLLPILCEVCPFDVVPTSSALAQLIFGDVLASAIMRFKNVSLEDFIGNHPGGRIGRRQLVKVSDIMLSGRDVPICFLNDTLGSVLVELSNKQCGAVCVIDDDRTLLGVFTDGDLRRALQQHGPTSLEQKMHALMTPSPRVVEPDLLAYEAMKCMEQGSPVTMLPVVDGKKLVGVVKMHDIVQLGL